MLSLSASVCNDHGSAHWLDLCEMVDYLAPVLLTELLQDVSELL